MTSSMTVYRNGTFEVAAPEVEGKCGVFGKTAFRFEGWFTATSDDLDERGFIVDNADLFRYFRDLYSDPSSITFTSCERMCLRALDDWQEQWPYAQKIVARIWGLEDVTYVEATWERPVKSVEDMKRELSELRLRVHDAEYRLLEREGSCSVLDRLGIDEAELPV